ncbi:DUF1824 family protein [Pannus brasiliensis CCIBt3594]|uniref:DUF1824 family protein n=1 Tax=Pannus brasiliensis CCIBt3594 TaxID=1427578 RepID=A0AAW9QW35_9CHRO
MSIEEALKLLKEYGCITPSIAPSPEQKETLRNAILLVNQGSEYINLGICADSVEEGLKALQQYLLALGYTAKIEPVESPAIEGAIYLKYSTKKQSYYVDSYTGTYRGVLISCQSEDDRLVGTYGHFPLDLFA